MIFVDKVVVVGCRCCCSAASLVVVKSGSRNTDSCPRRRLTAVDLDVSIFFGCVLASLYEGVSVSPSVHWSVRPLVRYAFVKSDKDAYLLP